MSRNTVISITGVEKQDVEPIEDNDFSALPQRPIFQRVSYAPRISLNGILMALICTVLLVLLGFVPLHLPSPLNIGSQVSSYDQLVLMQYTLQIPFALFVGALLGPFMGTTVALLFLTIGLGFYPIFANGGGLQYVAQPGFGYLLGAAIMTHLLGNTFYKVFQKKDNVSRSLKIIMKALVTVLMIHVIGTLYLVGLTLAGQIPLNELAGWALRLTVETAPYDILATTVLLCLVRQVRLALWLVLY